MEGRHQISLVAAMGAKRTSFHFPEEAAKHVFAIQRRTWLDGAASIIRAALSTFDDLAELKLVGYQIVVRTLEGKEHSYSPHCRYPGGGAMKTEGQEPRGPVFKMPKNFFFPAEVSARVASIRRNSHFHSNAEVIRAALSAFNDITELVTTGHDVLIRSEGRPERLFNPFGPLPRGEFDGLQKNALSGHSST